MHIKPKPPWLKKRLVSNTVSAGINQVLKELNLHTVCESALCPNRFECFSRGTATFMILGDICTRKCRFCAVTKGLPQPPDESEPENIATAVKKFGLKHVVITSVTRDDLADGGMGQFAATVRAVRRLSPATTVEILTPDFAGIEDACDQIAAIRPDIFNHNIETVLRLYPRVRPQADWTRSLAILKGVADRGIPAKSGMMLGLGETGTEISEALEHLVEQGVFILVLGQYLQPTMENLPVVEYIKPEDFTRYEQEAYRIGFKHVVAGPYARSSYMAEETIQRMQTKKED
jgi:lipoic acid synthetase